jgi:hypothetical protein
MVSRRESDDDYGKIVAQLGPTDRVIACADNLQWIIQHKSGVWRSDHFCTSREGVIRRVKGLPRWEVLLDLPDQFARIGTTPRPARSAKSASQAPSLPRRLRTGSMRGGRR